MATVFISDLHLHAERPRQTQALLRLLQSAAERRHELYILGDLFEYWLGDDDDSPPHPQVAAALSAFTTANNQARVMHGNRDFLIAEQFCKSTGCTLIGDPTLIELYGKRALLMHGDLLCTLDHDYQKLRSMVRDPSWQAAMLARPLGERRQLALQLRETSATETGNKQAQIMDVEQSTVEQYMRDHDVTLLIHGHTHRPADHNFQLNGRDALRLVLPDWYDTDGLIFWDEAGYQRMSVEQYQAAP